MKKTLVPSLPLLTLALCTLQAAPAAAQSISTGATNPGSAADVALGGSSFIWNAPTGALASGGSAATTAALLSAYTGTTDYLQLTNFGFNIPAGSTIEGIQANITREASNLSLTILGITLTGSVTDNSVQLVGPGVTSANRATGAAWPTSYGTAGYGSSTDLWGPTVWSTVIVNSASFGVQLSAQMNGGVLLGVDLIPAASVDLVTLDVTYSLPIVLPLRLGQWSVVRQPGGSNLLSWEMTADDNGAGEFVVERSADGLHFVALKTLPRPTGAGKNAGTEKYYYADEKPYADGPAYYRLRLHRDGQSDSWSSVQVISAKSIHHPEVKAYPNPSHNTVNVSAAAAFTRLSLTDEAGKVLWAKAFPGGTLSAQVSLQGLPQGLYFLSVDGAPYTLIKN